MELDSVAACISFLRIRSDRNPLRPGTVDKHTHDIGRERHIVQRIGSCQESFGRIIRHDFRFVEGMKVIGIVSQIDTGIERRSVRPIYDHPARRRSAVETLDAQDMPSVTGLISERQIVSPYRLPWCI